MIKIYWTTGNYNQKQFSNLNKQTNEQNLQQLAK